MNLPLPPPLARWVTAMNSHDSAAVTTCFTDDAVVEDEGHTYRGAAEIKAWITSAFSRYQPVLEVTDCSEGPEGFVLTGPVSGNFPGSPVVLHYHLTLQGDRIATLRCTV